MILKSGGGKSVDVLTTTSSARAGIVPIANIELNENNENMELARPSTISPPALNTLHGLAAAVSANFKSRAALQLENLALRHQLGVLHRSVKRPKLSPQIDSCGYGCLQFGTIGDLFWSSGELRSHEYQRDIALGAQTTSIARRVCEIRVDSVLQLDRAAQRASNDDSREARR